MFYTVIWRRLIYTDMLLYIFKLILVTSTMQHLMKTVENFVKTMSSTIESLKTSVSGKKHRSAYIGIMGKVGKKKGKPPPLVNYANTIIKQIMQVI